MNHKKKRAKNQRAGCLLCKPNKMNGWLVGIKEYMVIKDLENLENYYMLT